MINLLDVYQSISAKLQPLRQEVATSNILVRAVPNTEDIGRLSDGSGGIYFVLLKATAAPTTSVDAVIQVVTFVFRVVVEVPFHYGNKGLIYLTQRCIELLLGHRPPQAKRGMYLIGFSTFKDKFWIIELDFAFESIITESLVQDYEPLLQEILYQEEDKTLFVHISKDDLNG